MRQILRTADLDNTTVNAIREQLQEEMGQRVPEKDLSEAVHSFLLEKDRKHPGNVPPWRRHRHHADAWRCFLDEQKAAGIARGSPCTAVWMAGAVAYRCRTCQTGEQSSVCVRCFRAGNHEGHDYIMYRSETGGVCDCGDLESWSAQGCCDAHRPIVEDSCAGTDDEDSSEDSSAATPHTKTFPEGGIASDVSEAMLGVALERTLLALESCARARGPHLPPAAGARREAEGKTAEKLLRWLLRVADCGVMRAACAAAMTRRWDGPPAEFNLRAACDALTDGGGGDGDDRYDRYDRYDTRVASAWDNGGCPNARYVSGFGGLYGTIGATTTTDAVRAELRRRRLVVKTRLGCRPTDDDATTTTTTTAATTTTTAADEITAGVDPEINSSINSSGDTPRGEWPLAGTKDAGLLECLLRATCLPSLPEELAELSTTLILTLLFNPGFKVAFASALVRHYRDLVLFPNTLPWPGVSRMDRGGSMDAGPWTSTQIASGLSAIRRIRGEMSDGPISAAVTAMNVDDSDTDSDDDANADDDRLPPPAQLAARRRAAARRRGIDGGTNGNQATRRLPGGVSSSFPSGTFVQRQRECVSQCMDRVTVPIVSHSVLREGMLRELHDVIADALISFAHRGPSLPGRPNGVVDPACEGIKARLYSRPCNDLRMCLSQRSVARYWIAASTVKPGEDGEPGSKGAGFLTSPGDERLLKTALATLRSMQGMNPYAKKHGEHVERERSDWIHAMTAEMVVMSTLRHGAAVAADGLASERGQSKNDQTSAEEAEAERRGGHDKATVAAVAALERRRAARVAEEAGRRAAAARRYGLGDAVANSPSARSLAKRLESTGFSVDVSVDPAGRALRTEFPTLDQARTARYLCRALRETVDAAADWAYGERARETLVLGGDAELAAASRSSAEFDPERDPVSIHIPLHRFAAVLINAAFVAESVDADGAPVLDKQLHWPHLTSVLRDHPFTVQMHSLAEHPIRALTWSDAVRARAWVRNGEEVRRLSAVYASRYWAGLGRDADLALTQYALAASHSPHDIATRLLDLGRATASLEPAPRREKTKGTNVSTKGAAKGPEPSREPSRGEPEETPRRYVEGGEATAGSEGEPSPTRRRTDGPGNVQNTSGNVQSHRAGSPDADADAGFNDDGFRYRDPGTLRAWDLECARSAARTLVGLAKDRVWLSNHPFEIRVRRELVHALAIEARTHSELSDLLPTNLASESNDVDKVLTQVAVYEPPRTLDDKGKYSLRPDMWREFDGFFHRFAPADGESALRNAVTAYIRSRKEGTLEEDCAWHPKDMLAPPQVAPPPFAGVVRFARHPSIAAFVHNCVCYLHERRHEPDLQDIAVSAMALAALALDDRVFVEHLRDVGGGESTGMRGCVFPDPWAAALLRGGGDASSGDDDVSSKTRSPLILALESLAVGAGGEWAEDESHFVVIVAECARELLARLADAGLYAPGSDPRDTSGLRLGTGSESEAAAGLASGKDSPAQPDATTSERKAKALARQKAAMAQMAARQAAFRLAATDDDDDDESDSDGDADGVAGSNPDDGRLADRLPWDEKGVCGLCRGSEAHSNATTNDAAGRVGADGRDGGDEVRAAGNGPLVWVALAQRSNAPAVARRALHARFRNLYRGGANGANKGANGAKTYHRPKHVTIALETGGYVDVPLPAVDPLGHHHSTSGHGPGTPDPLPPDDPGSGEVQDVDELDEDDAKARLQSVMCYDCLPAPGVGVDPADEPNVGGYEYARHNVAAGDWLPDPCFAGAPLMDGEGVSVMCCGHQVHADCFDRYHASVLSRGSDAGAQRAQSGLGPDDFHCPTCRRLCNAVVPVMPATPSQLRSHRERVSNEYPNCDPIREYPDATMDVDGDGSCPDDPSAAAVRVVVDGFGALDEALRDARHAALAASLLADREAAKRENSSRDDAEREFADPIPGSDSPRARSSRSSRNSRSSVVGGSASAETTPTYLASNEASNRTVQSPHPYWSEHPGRYQVGAHLAKRLADAAREGPGAAGTATGPEPSVLARELAPWSALLHGVAQCEVSSRPVKPRDARSNPEPRPPQPAAATAAAAGRWRALRELARLALVGGREANLYHELHDELDACVDMLRVSSRVNPFEAAAKGDELVAILSRAMFASAASRARYWREANRTEEREPTRAGSRSAAVTAPAANNNGRTPMTGPTNNRETAEIAAAEHAGREALARVRAEIARQIVAEENEEANNNARADEIVAAMGGAAPTREDGEERDPPTDEGVAAPGNVAAQGGTAAEGGTAGIEAIRAVAIREPALARWAREMVQTHPERVDGMPAQIRNLLRGFAGVDANQNGLSSDTDGTAGDDVARLVNLVPKSTPETAPAYTALELLQLDPFAFLCELYARITRAYPGAVLCSERHGTNSQLALARAVCVVVATQGTRARQCANQGFAKDRDVPPIEEFIAPTLWRVEALLALLDGDAAPPVRTNPGADVARILTRLGFVGRKGVLNDAAGCVASAIKAIGENISVENKAALMNAWCGHMYSGDDSEDGDVDGAYWGEFKLVELPRDAEALSAIAHERPGLIALPERGEELYLSLMNTNCKRCQKPPRDPALCLVCGEVCCCAGACCRRGKHGECAQHAAVCGAGVGVFLLVKSTKILLIRGKRICLYPSVYLDQHGEEDEFLKRGRPLFLNERRYGALEDLWVNGALDYDTLALHTSRVGSDFY